MALALSLLYFIISGIQFWITDYCQTVLMIEPKKVFFFFSLTCITAPTAGVGVSGWLIHKCGGYSSPKALKMCSLFAVGALLSSLPVPFIDSYFPFQLCLWLLLFFGGFIVPSATGILLVSVKPNERTIANSVANFAYNIVGYLPSPFLYGIVQEMTGGG